MTYAVQIYEFTAQLPNTDLIDEGNQLSRMTHSFMQRLVVNEPRPQ